MPRPEKPLLLPEVTKILVVPDSHFPNVDQTAYTLMWEAATRFGVQRTIYLGDMLTFYSISRWDKDPTVAQNVGDLQNEIESFRPYHKFAQDLPGGVIWLEGNHEKRYTNMISRLPGLRGAGLSIQSLLGADMLRNTEYLTDDARLRLEPDVVIEHGHEVKYSLKPKYAAEAVLAQYPEQTTLFGHTHRIYSAVKTVRGRGVPTFRRVFSCGHLCDEEKENYVLEPDWQQGFMLITCYRDLSGAPAYDFHQVSMTRDKRNRPSFTLMGKVYK